MVLFRITENEPSKMHVRPYVSCRPWSSISKHSDLLMTVNTLYDKTISTVSLKGTVILVFPFS